MALVRGDHPTGVHTQAGPRAQTSAMGPGQTGGAAAHAHHPTGLAGLLDRGERTRLGPLGLAARNRQLLPAL